MKNKIDIRIQDDKGRGEIFLLIELKQYIIHDLYVCEENRKKRIGTSLLQSAEMVAKKLGANVVTLDVLEDSWIHDWYKRLGYQNMYLMHRSIKIRRMKNNFKVKES